jgi:polyisoprenoid-binding protein YceI
MRKICLAVAMMTAVSAQAAEQYTIDPNHTYPHFAINHLGFSTMHGRFDKTEGALTIDWAKKTGSVNVKIDAASVNTGFGKRDDHLRSPDFLNAAEFPAITYKSSKVVINDNKTATVEGELTMVGVTKPVTLKVDRISCGDHPMKKGAYVCGFDAKAKIKRSDFGVSYALPAVGDEMVLSFEVEAERK